MKPMFELERHDEALVDSPSHRAVVAASLAWEADPDLRRTTAVVVQIQSPGYIWLSILHCSEPNAGLGGRALDLLCSCCDEHEVSIRLWSSVFKPSRKACGAILDQDGLNAFYARRGFEMADARRRDRMIRTPKPKSTVPNHRACILSPDRATFAP